MNVDDPELMYYVGQAILQCKAIGYNPTRFQMMLKRHGAVETLRVLLDSKDPSEGFGTLLMKRRTDLTAEAIALRPEWQHHFTKEQRDRARERLGESPHAIADI